MSSDNRPLPDAASRWFLRGVLAAISAPAFILMAAFVGFAGLARESGYSLAETVVMTATIWALPSQVVLIGAMGAGASVLAAALAVSLSAVRLLPMIVAFVPVVRDENTPRWQLYGISHFVAITSWVFAMGKLPDVPRAVRMPYFSGFALSLTAVNTLVTAIAYVGIEHLPGLLAGALFFLMPLYFLISLWGAARNPMDKLAMAIGLVLGPIFFLIAPGFDLLWTGLVGGTIAYLIGRFRNGGAA
ncbi:MAG: AzlC family protein [Hyphomicrobiales bacterium]|nr:MAG: AzlC family protein [Hyphomicrobiales bacterium]